MVDIGHSQFNKYEMGLHIPSLEKLIQLAELLDSTIDYLLMGNNHNGINFQIEDKEAVIRMLDGMIIKNKTYGIMTMNDTI